LTQTGVVYSRKVDDNAHTFGVSGRLYKSNVLLYDHQTESLWSQLKRSAVSGPLAGKELQPLPAFRGKWATWRKRHPGTQVLSTETGHTRNYAIDPYEGYYRVGAIMFPVGDVRKDMTAKERVLGIEVGGHSKAYPLQRLAAHKAVLEDTLGEEKLTIQIDSEGAVVGVLNARGEPVPHTFAYWFAWQAFHPETLVYTHSP
jgi:hypothetical protein